MLGQVSSRLLFCNMSLLFYYTVLVIYAINSVIDILCGIVILLDPLFYSWCQTYENTELDCEDDGNSVNELEKNTGLVNIPLNKNINTDGNHVVGVKNRRYFCWKVIYQSIGSHLKPLWNCTLNMYISLFYENHNANTSPSCSTEKRFLVYWLISMGVCRLVAVVSPSVQMIWLVCILYCMEYLVFQYEGHAGNTIMQNKARILSLSALALAFISLVFILWI